MNGVEAVARARSLLSDVGRVQVAILAAVVDVDRRELFTHDAAGSTRGWLRGLPGGDEGQLARARRLGEHEDVRAAVAAGTIGPAAGNRVCVALSKIPDELAEDTTLGLLHDGIGHFLRLATGGVPPGADALTEARIVAEHGADTSVLAACAADRLNRPAHRVEPALVRLAQRLSVTHLSQALDHLTDAVRAEPSTDPVGPARYYLHLNALPGGDWDLRGVLDPETGQLLADVINRPRASSGEDDPDVDTRDAESDVADGVDGVDGVDQAGDGDGDIDVADEQEPTLDLKVIPLAGAGAATGAAYTPDPACTQPEHRPAGELPGSVRPARSCPGCHPHPRPPAGLIRHHQLRDLLRRSRGSTGPPGQAAPTALTVTATLAALTGTPGAAPAVLHRPGHPPTPLSGTTLDRLACHSELAAVLLNARGTPIGASHTARNATPRERRVLRAAWGVHCAVHGCPNTHTVPHHVIPFHRSRQTVLHDLVPICDRCHLDIHEGHRTLRLRNGRHIDDTGWTTAPHQAAA